MITGRMTDSTELAVAARALLREDRGPAGADLTHAWRLLIRGLEVGWLDDDELTALAEHLRAGRDHGVEELLFAHVGGRLRVALLDDHVECEPGAFTALVDALVARGRSG